MELFKLMGTIAVTNEGANNAIDETTGKASSASNMMVSAFKAIGTAVTTYFAVDKIIDFGTTCMETAASVQAMNSQFEQTFGEMQQSATDAIGRVADASNILDTRLQGVGTSIFAFARTTGMESAEALGMMERALQVTADSAAYYDRSLEDTAESLKSFLKGNYENDAALGLSCTEVTRNAAAMELYGQAFNDLTEAQKQLTLLTMVEEANALSGAMGQAAREGDGWENVMGNLKEAWKQFQATVGAPILQAVVPVIQQITEALSGMGGMAETVGSMFTSVIVPLVAGGQELAPLLLRTAQEILPVLQASIAETVPLLVPIITELLPILTDLLLILLPILATTLPQVLGILSGTIKGLADFIQIYVIPAVEMLVEWFGPVLKAVFTNAGLVLQGFLDVFNGIMDSVVAIAEYWLAIFTGDWEGVWESTKKFFLGIWDVIVGSLKMLFPDAIRIVKNGIDKLKSLFNFQWSFPKLKMPHFKINGSFSLNPPSVPTLGVDWYAKGGVMTEPTAFGFNPNTGNLMVGGEAGDEAIAPISVLKQYVAEAVASQNAEFADAINEGFATLMAFLQQYIPEMSNMQLVMDSGAVVGQLAPQMDVALGRLAVRNGRGV